MASLIAQLVKNPPAMWETWIRSLDWKNSPGEGKGYPLQYSGLENSMGCIVHGVTKSWTWLSNFRFHHINTWRTNFPTWLMIITKCRKGHWQIRLPIIIKTQRIKGNFLNLIKGRYEKSIVNVILNSKLNAFTMPIQHIPKFLASKIKQ